MAMGVEIRPLEGWRSGGSHSGVAERQLLATIVIPAYNEEEGLPIVLGKIVEAVDGTCELLVVDDGSTDRTAEVASCFPCRVIRHDVNRGKGEAFKTALENARGDRVVWIDADDTYPPDAIPRIVQALDDHDMVIASRSRGRVEIPAFNRLGNWLFRVLIRVLYGRSFHDPFSGLNGIRKQHLDAMGLSSNGFGLEAEICVKASKMKLDVLEFPIGYGQRIGTSKLGSIRAGYEILRTIVRHVRWSPKREAENRPSFCASLTEDPS